MKNCKFFYVSFLLAITFAICQAGLIPTNPLVKTETKATVCPGFLQGDTAVPCWSLNGKCYCFSKTKRVIWAEADKFCRGGGMTLLNLESKEEDQLINSHIKSTLELADDYYWISGRFSNSRWEWATNEPLTYTNWYPREPSHSQTGSFIYINYGFTSGIWFDEIGPSYILFICESIPEATTTIPSTTTPAETTNLSTTTETATEPENTEPNTSVQTTKATTEKEVSNETTEEIPTEATTENIPTEETTEQVPTEATTEQVPTEATTEEAPTEATTEEAPAEATTEEIPTEATTEEIPTEATTEEAPTEARTEVPTEATTPVQEKETTEVPTQPTTAVPMESTTESTTQSTEFPTQPTTAVPMESTTESTTQSTEVPTQPTTVEASSTPTTSTTLKSTTVSQTSTSESTTSQTSPTPPNCPNYLQGNINVPCWTLTNGKCYCFSKIVRNWAGADSFCRGGGMNLLKLETAHENNLIYNHHTKTPGISRDIYWTAGRYSQEGKAQWEWATTKPYQQLVYKNWYPINPVQPDFNEPGYCMNISFATPGYWFDTLCTNNIKFICESN